MSEIIEFPKNKETFIKQAIEAYAASQLSEAIQQLEKALTIDSDMTWYPLYVTLLLEAYEIDRADHFFSQRFPNIAEQPVNVELDVLYIRLLIELWELEKATEVIESRLTTYQYSPEALEQFHLLQQQVEQYEQDYQHDENQLLSDILQKVETVDSLPFYQQRELLPLLNHLDSTCYLECFQRLLVSKLHPILKTYLLELGIDKGLKQTVKMDWFNDIKVVDMATLKPVMSHELYSTCLSTIEKIVGDASLKDMLIQNTLLYFSIIYPYPETIFNNSEKFIETLLQRNRQEETNYQSEWFDKIEQMINQMAD